MYINVLEDLTEVINDGYSILYINPENFTEVCRIRSLYPDRVYLRSDGIFATFLLKLFKIFPNYAKRQSFDFTSLAYSVFDYLQRNDYTLCISGGRESEINSFLGHLFNMFPNLTIKLKIDGYVSEDLIVQEIIESDCDFYLLSLGSGKQERVTEYLLQRGFRKPIMVCGAFVLQTARTKNGIYYPRFIQKFNLRFIWRFIKEPHVIKRVIKYYPGFIIKLIRFKLSV